MTCIYRSTEVEVEIYLEDIVRDYEEPISKLTGHIRAKKLLAAVWKEVKLTGSLKSDIEEYLIEFE